MASVNHLFFKHSNRVEQSGEKSTYKKVILISDDIITTRSLLNSPLILKGGDETHEQAIKSIQKIRQKFNGIRESD